MAEDRVERRLAAIMAGDIAGYSRLMSADEEGTLRQLKAHRRELVDPKIAEYRGRIVKTTGDGMLVEFVSVVDAVRCAVDIARGMRERNVGIPADRRIEFRTGINVGDIISDGDDIFGDGVNVAARLEALAEPNGIMVSRVVYEQVRDKLNFSFDDLGEQAVKNIPRPIGVHRVSLNENAPAGAAAPGPLRPKQDAALRPSIAVLPFTNISGDPEQEYFADGISEDIITGLSKLRWFFVIARNSTFTYKGKAVDVKRVARELDVRYVLEGSVRKGGNRVRISAQLIDAATGNHIWADRYDGDLTDVFDLQDEITRKVVAAIEPKLLEAEAIRSEARSPEDLGGWDLVARALSHFWKLNEAESRLAINILRQATQDHPNYAPAHSMLAFLLLVSTHVGWTPSVEEREPAAQLARRAMELDENDPWAFMALGYLAFAARKTDEAVRQFRTALELNPNFAAAHGYIGWALAFDGRSDEALKHFDQSMKMSPRDPINSLVLGGMAAAHYLAGRYPEAVKFARQGVELRPGLISGHRILCASLAQAGQIEEAREAMRTLRQLHPAMTVAWIKESVPYTTEPMARFLDGLRKAGLEQ